VTPWPLRRQDRDARPNECLTSRSYGMDGQVVRHLNREMLRILRWRWKMNPDKGTRNSRMRRASRGDQHRRSQQDQGGRPRHVTRPPTVHFALHVARSDSSAPSASLRRVRAAWPEVAVPITRQPDASNASATTCSMVVFPAPATPSTSSAPRPEAHIPLGGLALLGRQGPADGLLDASDRLLNR
jgi:hypothetical protein